MIELLDRQKENVITFWHATQDDESERLFPRSVSSLEDALALFEASHAPDATSFGKIICVDGQYIGDVWIYGMDAHVEKMAMLSIVIFDKTCWGKGIGTAVVRAFCETCLATYKIKKIGAFVYAHNARMDKALTKAGFINKERFVEDGIESLYYEYMP